MSEHGRDRYEVRHLVEDYQRRRVEAVVKWAELLADVRRQLEISRFDSGDLVRDGKVVCSLYTSIASFMLEVQNYCLDHLHPDAISALSKAIGVDARDVILRGLARAVYGSASIDFFSWQPLCQPVGLVVYLRQQILDPDTPPVIDDIVGAVGQMDARIPEIRFDLQTEEVQAADVETIETSSTRIHTRLAAVIGLEALTDSVKSFGRDAGPDIVGMAIEESFAKFEREAVGEARERAPRSEPIKRHHDPIQDAELFREELARRSYEIHRRTMRGPGNAVIVGPDAAARLLGPQAMAFRKRGDAYPPIPGQTRISKIGVFDRRFTVYCDPFYPHDEVLMFYAGSSLFDANMILAPFCLSFGLDGNTGNCIVQLRTSYRLVNPSYFQVIPC